MTAEAVAAGGIRLKSGRGRWVLITAVLGSGIAQLDGTVVNVALPRIGEDLHASLAALQWTVNAYMLTLAGLILLGGSLGDRFGRRRLFVIGTVWFALASAVCGVAPDVTVLIAARAFQGIGGALLTPGSLALIQATYAEQDRSRAVGAWSGLGGGAAAVGPFLGGWLVDGPGWRWVFLINLPVAAVAVGLALRHVPESLDQDETGSFDVQGAALAALALAGLTYALVAAPTGGASPAVVGTAVAAVVLAYCFIRRERLTAHPIMPLDLFSSRLFSSINIITLCLYAPLMGVFFLLPVQLQVSNGYDALQAGLAILPITVTMLLLSSRSAALAGRIGPRLPLTVGPLVAAIGMLMLHRVGPGHPYVSTLLPALLVQGLGMAAFVAPLTSTVLAAVPVARAGIASGINNAAARAAGLVAVAALPLAVGLSGDEYASGPAVHHAFGTAVILCAALMAAGGGVAWLTVRSPHPGPAAAAPQCTVNCGMQAPPLEPRDRGGRLSGTNEER
ncbi:MFS transporter [Streptomyces sp. SL13]|uniref:MFS transporter n=1 Tax=Streptantibioticus silvisoli TaxID=2705255 RepID=A0AA90HBM1_9ACTN|nr:MFS transporter [Streptantibioticus silvisoli]MDI5973834.1 MFS transporter [Streptantibioticus silvisoli]